MKIENENTLKVTQWLLGDDTGLSSKSLAREYLGLPHDGQKHFNGINYPHDPADIGRCFRLIEICPSVRDAIFSLAGKNEIWKNLSERWDEIHACMDAEVGIHWQKGRRAEKTYSLMRSVIEGKQAS